jgi:LysM repeat protein
MFRIDRTTAFSARRIMRTALAAVLLLVSAVPAFAAPPAAPAPQTEAPPVASVRTGAANIRSGPGIQFGSIASIPFGFGVNLTARNEAGDWVYVTLNNGVAGWMSTSVLFTAFQVLNLPVNASAQASAIIPTATVNVGNVNVRTNADPDSAIIATIPFNTPVQLIGRNFNGTWANVRLQDGRTGWIVANALLAQVPVRSLAPSDGSVVAPVAAAPSTGSGGGTSTYRTYIVQPGDTLGAIAARYGVNVYTLAQLNGIYNINYVQAGARLLIPA